MIDQNREIAQVGSREDIDEMFYDAPTEFDVTDDDDFGPQAQDDQLSVIFASVGVAHGTKNRQEIVKRRACIVSWIDNNGATVTGSFLDHEDTWWRTRFPAQYEQSLKQVSSASKRLPLSVLNLTHYEEMTLQQRQITDVRKLAAVKPAELRAITLPNAEKIVKRAVAYIKALEDFDK
jgi:hypothetical protein